MTKEERCQHPDCIYRNRNDPHATGNCNYCSMTGRSQIARELGCTFASVRRWRNKHELMPNLPRKGTLKQ